MGGPSVGRERRTVFGEVAQLYDDARPSYPDALVDAVLGFADAQRPTTLEIGAGTGKATALFAARGLEIHALEPNDAMAQIAERNTAAFPAVAVEPAGFEDWDPAGRRFDLVISAQAWHWVDPDQRCSLARRVLVTGGSIALFWNRPVWDHCPLRPALDDVYEGVADTLEEEGLCFPSPKAPQIIEGVGEELESSGLFGPVQQHRFSWSETYSTERYLKLLRTLSDHRMLPPHQRAALLTNVGKVIDEAGGAITIDHETHLHLSQTLP